MALDPKTYIESLYSKYNDGSGYIRVVQDGTDYVVTIVGSYSNRGRYKIRRYDSNGRLIYDGFAPGTGGTFQPPANIDNTYQNLFNAPMTDEGIDNTPIGDPVAPPPPPPVGPNLDTITSNYSLTDGYGEADVHNALEDLLGVNIPEQPDVQDNYQQNLYGIDAIGAPEAWSQGYTGQDIIVAVLDSGVDVQHADLDANIWQNTDEIAGNGIDDDGNGYIDDRMGYDFVNNDGTMEDLDGHGTHVAGTIAAEDNGIGVIGAAYNAKIMPVKVLPADIEVGGGTWQTVADGIYYAVNNGAHVINMSLGGGYIPPQVIRDAIKYANDNGVICVMAAGNSFDEDPLNAVSPEAPGSYASEYGIVVGAVDRNGDMTSFSNRAGNPIDWDGDGEEELLYTTSAGLGIWSTLPGDMLGPLNGTSMATPLVAAACAILLQADPSLTPDQIRVLLANNTK